MTQAGGFKLVGLGEPPKVFVPSALKLFLPNDWFIVPLAPPIEYIESFKPQSAGFLYLDSASQVYTRFL